MTTLKDAPRLIVRVDGKLAGQKPGAKTKPRVAPHQVPPVAQLGQLTLRQIRRAVDVALRGKTFEADA